MNVNSKYNSNLPDEEIEKMIEEADNRPEINIPEEAIKEVSDEQAKKAAEKINNME